ncbi:mCG147155 [Mus musculus]|nr:mCG147155 [Mus musculus]
MWKGRVLPTLKKITFLECSGYGLEFRRICTRHIFLNLCYKIVNSTFSMTRKEVIFSSP